jgi:uncharacterized protein YbjT (DUF2867 family)
MFVVTGANGKTGRATVEALLNQRQPVTAAVHSEQKAAGWKSRGVATAVLDLADRAALTRLLTGKAGAFLFLPPAEGVEDARLGVLGALPEAVRASGIPHVVLLSSVGAQHPAGTGPIAALYSAEQALKGVVKSATFLRPSYFMENWAPAIAMAQDRGVLPTFLTPARKIPQIATRDVGVFAAQSLVDPPHGIRIREITGPQDYSPEEIAQIVGKLLGKTVTLQPAPVAAAVPAFVGMGLPEGLARQMAEMFEGINSGLVDFENRRAVERGAVEPAAALAPLTVSSAAR